MKANKKKVFLVGLGVVTLLVSGAFIKNWNDSEVQADVQKESVFSTKTLQIKKPFRRYTGKFSVPFSISLKGPTYRLVTGEDFELTAEFKNKQHVVEELTLSWRFHNGLAWLSGDLVFEHRNIVPNGVVKETVELRNNVLTNQVVFVDVVATIKGVQYQKTTIFQTQKLKAKILKKSKPSF